MTQWEDNSFGESKSTDKMKLVEWPVEVSVPER